MGNKLISQKKNLYPKKAGKFPSKQRNEMGTENCHQLAARGAAKPEKTKLL